MKKLLCVMTGLLAMAAVHAQDLRLNELDYFERQGVNILVFSNSFNGGFNDEKNSGIEIIHHGVRTVQGGAASITDGLHYDPSLKPYEVSADFSAIPGNVAPGLLFRKPDHFENYDDWPFLWGQNEGTIAGNTQYVIFGSSFKNIVNKK